MSKAGRHEGNRVVKEMSFIEIYSLKSLDTADLGLSFNSSINFSKGAVLPPQGQSVL
ncbi:hypothetical protein SBDP1_480020 [Syntrophobacter sp. SbD1]|nr:hypothetical protein SBDP1_480020 [Syntrophobacter sp. SbD1]